MAIVSNTTDWWSITFILPVVECGRYCSRTMIEWLDPLATANGSVVLRDQVFACLVSCFKVHRWAAQSHRNLVPVHQAVPLP